MTVGISGTQTYATTDTAAVTPFSGVVIGSSDPNASVTVSFFLFPAPDGTLSNLGGLVLAPDANGNPTYSITGTAASVQATLRGVVFTPMANQVPVGQTVTTQFTLSASDGSGVAISDSATIIVAAAGAIVPVIGPVLLDTADTATVPNPGGSVVVTSSKHLQTITVTTPVAGAAQTADSVRIEAVLNGSTIVYDQTFASPYGSAAVQAAIAQADAALAANGASAGAPTLASSVTSTQSSTTTVQTGSFLDSPEVTNGPTTTFGPGVIGPGVAAGGVVRGYFTILAGQTDIDVSQTEQTTVDQTVTTTPTTLTTQAYVISGSNDGIGIAGAAARQQVTDDATLRPFAGVTVTDANAGQTEAVTVTPSATVNGMLTDPNAATDGGSAGRVLTLSGTAAQVTADLEALVFTPTQGQAPPGSTVTTRFTIAITDTAGATASDATTSVVATAQETAPVIGGTSSTPQVYTAAQTAAPFATVTVADPNYGASETATITLTNGGVATDADGTLPGATKTGVGTYTLAAGAPRAVQAALRALVFSPTPHVGTITGFTLGVSDGIAPTVTDANTLVQTLPAGVAPVPGEPGFFTSNSTSNETNTVTTPVAQTNDTAATTITAVLDGNQVVYQQSFMLPYSDPAVQAAVAQANAILVQDGAMPSAPALTSTTTANQGSTTSTVTTSQQTGAPTVAVTSNFGPGTLTQNFGGTPGSSFALLAGQEDTNVNTDTVTTVNQTATTTTTVLTTQAYAVNGSNDAYAIGGVTAALATTDAAAVAPFAAVTLANADTVAIGTASVTLSAAANGVLSTAGAATIGANGSSASVAGSTAAIQAALRALVFTPTAHEVLPGQAVTTGITLAVSDGVAHAGAAVSVVATAAPVGVPAVASPILTVAENGRAAAIGIAAPTDPSFAPSQLTIAAGTLPGDGTVTLADGVTAVAAGQALTAAQLTGLLFTPAPGQFGRSSAFTYTVTDPEGNASTGTATLAIGPALGNPVVSSPRLTVAPNAAASSIGIAAPTDPNFAAAQLTVSAAALPTNGVVTLADGVTAVAFGQRLTVPQLTGLLFKPAAGVFGASSAFTYTVVDPAGNGGTAAAILTVGPAPPSAQPFGGLAVTSPAPSGTVTVTAQLNPAVGGTFSQLSGGTVSADGTTYSVSGTPAVVNAALGAVTFTPASGQVAAFSFTATISDVAGNSTLSDSGSLKSILETLHAGDTAVGGSGPDTLLALAAGATLVAGTGAGQRLLGNPTGASTLIGGPTGETFFADGGPTTIQGGAGHDTIAVSSGNVMVTTGPGGSLVALGAGTVTFMGNGPDTIIGGSGSASITTAANSIVGLGAGQATVAGGAGAIVIGGAGAETVSMTTGGVYFGGSGADVFLGLSGGGAGSSTVVGGSGAMNANGGAGGGAFFGGADGGNVLVAGQMSTTLVGGGPATG